MGHPPPAASQPSREQQNSWASRHRSAASATSSVGIAASSRKGPQGAEHQRRTGFWSMGRTRAGGKKKVLSA